MPDTITIRTLIDALNEIVAHPDIDKWVKEDEETQLKWIHSSRDEELDEFSQKMEAVISLADQFLITQDGQPNYKNHLLLKQSGLSVFRGEYDSFGWLTGIIATPKGRIQYG